MPFSALLSMTSKLGKTVTYQIFDDNVHIYYNTKLIALHELSEKKLNFSEEHYIETLKCKFRGKTEEEIFEMAKKNLEVIGGVYNG